MLAMISFNRIVPIITVSGWMIFNGLSSAYAGPMASTLDDFHPNCDIRSLGLTREQNNELRNIRKDYKKALDKSIRKDDRILKNRRRDIIKILSSDRFNQDDARDYVEKRYISSMDFAVDELSIQHRFYKLLSPTQRQHWLNICLK
ncbi:Spy/CpxP family protein refolding chaperone [Neisseria dumasiana]|nr:hypothetical protein [Neisseria dumasiana]